MFFISCVFFYFYFVSFFFFFVGILDGAPFSGLREQQTAGLFCRQIGGGRSEGQ